MSTSKMSSPRDMIGMLVITLFCFIVLMIQRSNMTMTSISGRQKQEQEPHKSAIELSKLVSEIKQLKLDLKAEIDTIHTKLDEYHNDVNNNTFPRGWDSLKFSSSTDDYRYQNSAPNNPFETSDTDKWILNHATDEWNISSIYNYNYSKNFDPKRWKEYVKLYQVKLPGIPSSALTWKVPFFHSSPSWLLSKRTFVAEIFFCPPNGHEGTITHLIGQLLHKTKPSDGSFVDVGSNLGFYSLMAWKMGYTVYAIDIQPMCLWMLYSLAHYSHDNDNSQVSDTNSKDQSRLHLHLMGLSDMKAVAENSEGGCDYENYYLTRDPKTLQIQRPDEIYDPNPAGRNVQVPILSLDQWIEIRRPQLPIQVLKMDTEGAEGKILLGMTKTLSSKHCPLRNFIVEITPAHWYRFGGEKNMENNTVMINSFVNVVNLYHFKAYLLYTDESRKPPTKFHSFLQPLSTHPIMPNVKDTGCNGAKFYAIQDMTRFFMDYCFDFAATVIRPGGKTAKGFCGNVWFQREEKECK